jgi:hypothetical protein
MIIIELGLKKTIKATGTNEYLDRNKQYMYKKITLICKSVSYHSQLDEFFFFEWIKNIPSIVSFDGIRDELYLHVKSKRISNKDLREIIGLFYRYKVDMKQLQLFLNNNNRAWFKEGHKGYWYRRVFGTE